MDQSARAALVARFSWWMAYLAMAVVVVTLLIYPAARTFAKIETNFIEGWNAYRAEWAASGVRLYAAPGVYSVTNYPPLSFHLTAVIGKWLGDYVRAGRLLNWAALAVLVTFVALTARLFTGAWRDAVLTAIVCLAWLAAATPDRIGAFEPQFLGSAAGLAGFYCYLCSLRSPAPARWLCLSALAFATAGFVKHNLLALPLTVAIHLLTANRKRFFLWASVGLAAALALTALSVLADGKYFFSHLLLSRIYTLRDAAILMFDYIEFFQLPVAAAFLWSLWNFSPADRRILALAFFVTHLVTVAFSGGFGVDRNHWYEPMIVTAIILGVAIRDVALAARLPRPLLSAASPLLFLVLLAGMAPRVARVARSDFRDLRDLPQREAQFLKGVEVLKNRPGPAMCDVPLLCYAAGKQEEFDPYVIMNKIGAGLADEDQIVTLVRRRHFAAITLRIAATDSLEKPPPHLYTSKVYRALLEQYRPVLRTARFAILAPSE